MSAFCMLCDHLGGVDGRSYGTNHTMAECERCENCHVWTGHKGGIDKHRDVCPVMKILDNEMEPPAAKQGTRVIPLCRHWARGGCDRHDECGFRHSNDPNARSAREEAGNIECFGCGEWGHHIKNCPDKVCKKCGKTNHATERCIQCFNCDEWGHHIKACPEEGCGKCGKTNHKKPQCIRCRECREWGHREKFCENKCRECDSRGHGARSCPYVYRRNRK